MKIQDILFYILFAVLLYFRNPKWFAGIGILCLFFSIPLFYFWIFFTAERLTWYAAAYFTASCLLYILELRKDIKQK